MHDPPLNNEQHLPPSDGVYFTYFLDPPSARLVNIEVRSQENVPQPRSAHSPRAVETSLVAARVASASLAMASAPMQAKLVRPVAPSLERPRPFLDAFASSLTLTSHLHCPGGSLARTRRGGREILPRVLRAATPLRKNSNNSRTLSWAPHLTQRRLHSGGRSELCQILGLLTPRGLPTWPEHPNISLEGERNGESARRRAEAPKQWTN